MTVFTTTIQPFQGSYLTPAYEEATVGEAMHPGVLAVPPDATAVDAARIMASNHVHCVVLRGASGWELVSSMDILQAAVRDDDSTAASLARPALTATARESLVHVARQMAEAGAEHVLVIDAGGRPVGVLSSLDVAGIVAWGRG